MYVYIHILCIYNYKYIYIYTPLYLMVAMLSERPRGPRRWQLLQLPWGRLDLGAIRCLSGWGPLVSTNLGTCE